MEPDPIKIKDFFISYTKVDRAWAEWIGWRLEKEGYTCILQAWDFRPGGNFVLDMQRAALGAQRTIAVLSPDYLTALYTQPEWAAAFVQDPTSKDGKLLPVRIRDCKPDGILAAIVYIDLVTLDESTAHTTLIEGVKRTRAKPTGPLPFPGSTSSPTPKSPVSFPGTWPEIWEVPYRRNPFFTGRDELLQRLHDNLTSHKTMALTQPQAINGLGGIGKTQTALEYANRHLHEYRYVLWATADTSEGLSADYVKLAELLQVPGSDEKDQQITINAFKRWLASQRDCWLLILDNADDVEMVRDFLPDGPHMKGRIILTTRAQALGGIANALDIEKMGKEESVQFLLKRARTDVSNDSERTAAEAIVKELDGFPLALDQAGAYIEETGYSLARYFDLYRTRHQELLRRRGRLVKDHPETVATTWSLSLQKVEQENRAAIALLRLCAFLAPDAIQEEMIMEGAKYLGKDLDPVASDEWRLNKAIEILRKYSLVKRNQDMKMLSMHRLVQVVLKDGMTSRMQRLWAERAVQVVNAVFPFGEYENWERCRLYLPHAQICIELIKLQKIVLSEAAYLLHSAGYYFFEQREYKQAEDLYEEALLIYEKTYGLEHPYAANTLHALALLYQEQSKHEQAREYYEQVLSISEKTLGLEHPDTATTLYELGSLYLGQGKYEEAQRYYEEALLIYEKTSGLVHSSRATMLHGLGRLYYDQGKYEEAQRYYEEALLIYEKTSGLVHPYAAVTLHELGSLYLGQGKYEEAQRYYEHALAIYEKIYGLGHPNTAATLHALAVLYYDQKQYERAEPLYQQALKVREKLLDLDHFSTINTIKSYARLLYESNRDAEAKDLLARINLTLDDLYS